MGLLVSGDRVVSPPVLARSALVVGLDGARAIARIGPEDARLSLADGRILVPRLPGSRPQHEPVRATGWLFVPAFNRAWGEVTPDGAGTAVVVVGHQIVSVSRGPVAIPLNGFVLRLPPGEDPPASGPVSWSLQRPVAAAMAARPRLLAGGAVDLDRQRDDLAGSAPP